MARRKNAKSLFEVITDSHRPPVGPAGRDVRQGEPAAGAPPRPGAAPETARGRPVLKASGEQTISLSQFNAVSIAIGVVLLVLLAFLLGQAIRIRPAGGAGSGGGMSPLGPEFVGGAGAGQTALPPMVPDNYQRSKGYRYWVIHENVASTKDGLEMKKFFHRNLVGVTVNPDPSLQGQFIVKDTRGFGPTPSPQMAAMIREREDMLERLCELYKLQVRSGLISGRDYDFKKLSLETEE
ncbi:MAG TPA: hypothetical protein VM389_08310 [Phycisphaerae bacterium]|nr:hypothetical protein [Phycisphaerae bacterium]HUU22524.1 hypothetical protein [Phycisphaerae bacterium]